MEPHEQNVETVISRRYVDRLAAVTNSQSLRALLGLLVAWGMVARTPPAGRRDRSHVPGGLQTVGWTPVDRFVHAGEVSHELAAVLNEFCGAFRAQDGARLRAVFADGDVSFVASEAIELHDRAELDRFIDAYTAQDVWFSFHWGDKHEVVLGDIGWVVAFGHETAHSARGDHSIPFRMTLVCVRRERAWRIVHLHASTPSA